MQLRNVSRDRELERETETERKRKKKERGREREGSERAMRWKLELPVGLTAVLFHETKVILAFLQKNQKQCIVKLSSVKVY